MPFVKLGGVRHAGEHEQRRHPGGAAALDVGVQPVADQQGPARTGAPGGLPQQRRAGLASHLRLRAGR